MGSFPFPSASAKQSTAGRRRCPPGVLTPAMGAGARLVVREVVPGISHLTVVLAPRPPLALDEMGAPFPPGCILLAGRRESGFFGAVALVHVSCPFRTR